MKKTLGVVAAAATAALILAGCSTTAPAEDAGGKDVTLWLMGGDTPDTLRDFLKTEYADATGGTLTIEEQAWGDAIAKLTTALPDAENTPDVVEIGNTWSPTFTNAGAFSDLSDMYEELGGDSLLPSFVEAGVVDGANYALPYYFGSRYVFYRKDIWAAAGKTVPTSLEEFNATVAELESDDQSGFYIGGEDWRNGVSWVFANGGDLAMKDGGEWASSLSDAKTVKGLEQFQALFQDASNAPVTEADSTPWVNINDNESTGAPESATIIAPGWAHWSIGDLAPDPEDDTKTVATWNDDVFGVFALPGAGGGIAPVFAGGSNIAISAASKNQDASKELLKIIFSEKYQNMLGENGLGPANLDYTGSLGDDQFAKALAESAAGSKLTPAAPGWAAVEGSGLLEEFFGKVAGGGDVKALAAEYDEKITPLLND
ncbi:carbohydrate ABC transporter substrate-binding protein (CUT1 family) [Homoserinimonas aerilata]|uniref:Carbohydrate ABC transporter substrate-binding protein (CUT1 family) n=1 Tax=Homoserinimonas aerilata TaxID=1162970 RepID=A0A542YFZ1_9MICO|nr:extracellular solute-binding protein [Homoserinimonas aerilata]TQL46995.1 carbohydrate ABC transporter substrate-binding protein (CUT1 family) [Homoserinimonas aerilata]